MNEYIFDIVIVGSGAAGLYCALNLADKYNVLLVTKTNLTQCNSYLAQGGITTILGPDDKQAFIRDTMKAGQYENSIDALDMLADRSDAVVEDLLRLNMPFSTDSFGRLLYTREGAHSKNRILYAKDETGRYLVETLLEHVLARPNITVWEQTSLIDILECPEYPACAGVLLEYDHEYIKVYCRNTVLACGGIGGLFKNTTNAETVTGDAIAVAHKHNIKLKNLDYIQFHPTSLYEPDSDNRRFLISESLRGEGALLLNANYERFVDELLPRDEVTDAIYREMAKHPFLPYVYLDISYMDSEYLKNRFPNIYEKCLNAGYDLTVQPIPVIPSQHYHMGGITVDLKGRTSMPGLYAIGEAGCSNVHGANRLASNSLLEALVYGREAARDMNVTARHLVIPNNPIIYDELKDAGHRSEIVRGLIGKPDFYFKRIQQLVS